MQGISQYLLTLTGAAMISGVLLSLIPEGTSRGLLRLVLGVFLTVTALSPLSGVSIPDWESVMDVFSEQGCSAAAVGEEMALQEREILIKAGLEAYILDKASALGCSIRADVQVDPEGKPVSVCLRGTIPAQSRQMLAAIITEDLGIPEENQQWTGEN